MLRIVWPLLLLAFTIYNLVDCIQTKDTDVRNLPKLLWLVLILLFNVVGGIAWLVAGRPSGAPSRLGRSGPPAAGPRGPDDDPDFLRRL